MIFISCNDNIQEANIVIVGEGSVLVGDSDTRHSHLCHRILGLYYCNVSNKYGLNRATNKILVYKPSYFVRVPTPRILAIEAGEVVKLQCEAVADPKLSVTYKWTLNGVPIVKNSDVFEIKDHELIVSKTRGRVSGIIDCMAITDVDVKVSSMQLIIKDVPSTPKMISFECTERKAVLRWNASNEHSDPIKRYIVEMQTGFRIGHWEKVEEETNIEKLEYEADITLTPWVNYTFRVVAENSHGRSDSFGEPAEMGQCQTRPSFPYSNPHGVRAEGTQPDNLVIYWKPMDKYYWNAPNLQYLVRYKLNREYTAWNEFLVEDPLENHTIVREQPTFQPYLVQVRAVNAIGPSIIEPNIVIGWSGEDVPSAGPKDFKIDRIANFSWVNFTWTGVNASSVNGHFEGYIIEYKRDDVDREPTRVFSPVGTTHKTVTSLFANSNYTAVVRTKNRQYMSKPSNAIRFATPEGVPSKVHDLRVYAVGATSILLKWSPPLTPNGIVRGYFISFHDDRNETEETYVIHKQTHYLHERGSPDTGYRIAVWGETSAGEGPKTARAVRTWPDRNPDVPVFRVKNVTTDTMWIEWVTHVGNNWKMPGAAFYVNFSEHGKGEWNSSEPIYLPEFRVKVDSLKEDTRYDVIAVARDGRRYSESGMLTISTYGKGDSGLNKGKIYIYNF
ncbi:hypothetical protein WR25_12506 [Diploscapter pachys]|uniref:Uncharacterized protein n=1 Tax=Diploscapter pachys TaxID=2018661 RepID=A0A2A2JDT1_9BILA|nr:hypothetical protein WR25_12506 [Diploscapter pachys]